MPCDCLDLLIAHAKLSLEYLQARVFFFGHDAISQRFPNFSFHPALSSPLEGDDWTGPTGFIHEVVLEQYLGNHPNPRAVEFYLCGPPQMMKACQTMLRELGVAQAQITFDEF